MHPEPDLFPPEPVLEKRMGDAWFKKIPAAPGVYQFYDHHKNLLYVGKAVNLRRRLFGYKRAKSGQVSRKVASLITQTTSITYEVTTTEQKALLLENHLIRAERPPFNHQNKNTETYYFVYLNPDLEMPEFRLAMHIQPDSDEAYWHGCFKGHHPVRRSLGALLQLLWMATHSTHNPVHLPVQLISKLTPLHYRLQIPHSFAFHKSGAPELLTNWIQGKSNALVDWLTYHLLEYQRNCAGRFAHCFIQDRLEWLDWFYTHKLLPHRQIRGNARQIGQQELDDAMVTGKLFVNNPIFLIQSNS